MPIAGPTYVHVHRLPITTVSIQNSRYDDELVFRNKVPDAALMPGCFVAIYGMEVELESRSEGRK